MSDTNARREHPLVIESAEEAKAALLESIDRLRAEIVNDEVNMLLLCGNRHDTDFFVCTHLPPDTNFGVVRQAIEHLMTSGVLPFYLNAPAVPDEGAPV